MTEIASICIYCGSSNDAPASHMATARAVGAEVAARGIHMVFGGGRVGLMGATADAAMAAGGTVTGVIPQHLHDIEIGHTDLTELLVVDNMHTRKREMFERSDAFVVLPGGLGSLEEFFEVVTWRQIGIHDKPILILNPDGYWDPLLGLIEHVIDTQYAHPSARALFVTVSEVADILPALGAAPEPAIADRPNLL